MKETTNYNLSKIEKTDKIIESIEALGQNFEEIDRLIFESSEEIKAIPTRTSQLTNDSGFITEFTETDPTVPTHVKNIQTTDISNWNNKSNFSGSYNDLSDKPTIPTATNQLTNNSNFISSTIVTAFWTGTQAEYDALESYNNTTLYLITE